MADSGDILADLKKQFQERQDAGEFDDQLDDFMENQVVPVWRDNAPEDTGNYKNLVQVTKPAQNGKGQVGALDEAANIIEYGSEDTPEFAPRAKTEAHFNNRGGAK